MASLRADLNEVTSKPRCRHSKATCKPHYTGHVESTPTPRPSHSPTQTTLDPHRHHSKPSIISGEGDEVRLWSLRPHKTYAKPQQRHTDGTAEVRLWSLRPHKAYAKPQRCHTDGTAEVRLWSLRPQKTYAKPQQRHTDGTADPRRTSVHISARSATHTDNAALPFLVAHTRCMPEQLPHLQAAAPCEGHAPTQWCLGRALQVPPPFKKTTAPQPACFETASNLPCHCRCFLSLECLPALHTTRVSACKAALQCTCGHMHMTARCVRTPITNCKHVSVHCHIGRQTMPLPSTTRLEHQDKLMHQITWRSAATQICAKSVCAPLR